MAVIFSYDELEDAFKVAEFVQINGGKGSHRKFKNNVTGLSQPIPFHGKTLQPGTGRSIMDFIILSALIQKIDLTDKKYKLSEKVVVYVNKKLENARSDVLVIIPNALKGEEKIGTRQEAIDYLLKKYKQADSFEDEKQKTSQEMVKLRDELVK